MEELKTKRAEEAAVAEANKPDPDCPKGHRKMSEEERRSTLAQLKQSALTTFKEYILTPLRVLVCELHRELLLALR